MKKSFLIFFSILCFLNSAFADGDSLTLKGNTVNSARKNSIYVELGGNGVLGSINYDRLFYENNKIHLTGRIGLSIYPSAIFQESPLLMPVEADILIGSEKKFFETGLGFTRDFHSYKLYIYDSNGSYEVHNYYNNYLFVRLGYRSRSEGGFLFRVAATPVMFF